WKPGSSYTVSIPFVEVPLIEVIKINQFCCMLGITGYNEYIALKNRPLMPAQDKDEIRRL
ncbi:MAG: hypothetical protein ACREUM_02385, partial [Nitrosospira sp.]